LRRLYLQSKTPKRKPSNQYAWRRSLQALYSSMDDVGVLH
jgi:hypothetical protein